MSHTFYHVDNHGELEEGSVLELNWPGKLKGDVITMSPPENQAKLQELFPEGLSSHGARYAPAALVCKDGVDLDGGWDFMAGQITSIDLEKGMQGTDRFKPYIVQYEFFLELARQLKFREERSRFQSYFGFEELEDAIEFRDGQRNSEGQIVEVECSSYSVKDMKLVDPNYFGEIFSQGQQYWSGEPGSENPTWEVLMEPPVEVMDIPVTE